MIVIGENFKLPLDAVTETFGVIAKRRVGKSNLAVVMAEGMYENHIPFVAIDPKGDWWGVRSSSDGKKAGLSVIVFGGKHADEVLHPDSGAFMADLIAKERITCVLDVSQFSKGEQIRFLLPFANRLLQVNEEPLHVFCEECDDYIPQSAMNFKEPDSRQWTELMVVRAFSKLIRHGGFKGIGCTLISQRPALVNKNVLSQVETFFILRIQEPLDIQAIEARVKRHPMGKELLDSLQSLKVGEGWVFSPAVLEVVERVDFLRRRTFDSGRTPKMGEARIVPKRLADVDLASIRKSMESYIEESKANDPAHLKAEIARLQRMVVDHKRIAEQLEAQLDQPAEVQVEEIKVPVEVPFIPEEVQEVAGTIDRLLSTSVQNVDNLLAEVRLAKTVSAELLQHITTAKVDRSAGMGRVEELVQRLDESVAQARAARAQVGTKQGTFEGTKQAAKSQSPRPTPSSDGTSSGTPNKTERSILTVLAQWPEGRTKNQIAIQAGLKATSKHIENVLSSLRTRGYVNRGVPIQITPDGLNFLGPFAPLPMGMALVDHWAGRLSGTEAKVLRAFVDAYPEGLNKYALAARTGLDPNSKHIENVTSKLRTLTLVEGRGADTKASAMFFESAGRF